jgi:nucleotide-binding universal stress UspA family protein
MGEQIPRWLEDRLFQEQVEAIGLGHFEPTAEERQRVHEHLVRWCGELPDAFQDLAPLVMVGDARQEIMKAIESEKADLVVAGARGRGAIGRLLLGSTSEHLLMHAPCSVLIVRQHERA